MSIPKSQQRAVAKYQATHYDRVALRLPKGQLEALKGIAEAEHKSLNAWIQSAIEEKKNRPD